MYQMSQMRAKLSKKGFAIFSSSRYEALFKKEKDRRPCDLRLTTNHTLLPRYKHFPKQLSTTQSLKELTKIRNGYILLISSLYGAELL